MIGIARPAEPPQLAAVRLAGLAAAQLASQRGQALDLKGYDVVKDELAAMQGNKCCYCEKREESPAYRDVEHYRPKSLYWWLTWTWENLLFACNDCNRRYKRNQFPLDAGCVRLTPGQAPPAGERPLVLDPGDASVDPTQEIVFRREKLNGKDRWVPHGVTDRGRATIEVCGLARPSLLDLYVEHVNDRVRTKLEGFFKAHDAGDARTAFDAWDRAQRSLQARGQPFRGLSHDALSALVSAGLRERYNLTLRRPTP